MSDDSDIVRDFLVESYENLDQLDRELVGLEKDPTNAAALGSIFRAIHTIKGTCGFLGFSKLEAVAHVGESLLTRLRDRQLTLNPAITTGLLGMVDAIRQMLKQIESTGRDGTVDYPELREALIRLQNPTEGTAGPVPTPAPPKVVEKKDSKIQTSPATPVPPSSAAPPAELQVQPAPAPPAPAIESAKKTEPAKPAKTEEPAAAAPVTALDTIRVGVNVLDKLMTLVGELVLARNQLLQFANSSEDTSLQAVSQRMNLIAIELQEGVMKTRMQPIGNIWGQFPRTVRDVALSCGKQVKIVMEGKETELDKTIIEAIKDPLTHLVRNSVDHGIELPEARLKAGKDVTGRLVLRAFHEGGQVNIEISDDGAGLNPERLRQKAMERALITAEQATRMSEREVFNLIFLPGFSTAAKITNVSGRGVGMDVVKTNVEKIGGTVDLHSTLGMGTTVRVKIPLTLAIIPALVVTCAEDRYAIPQVSLLELVRLEPEQAQKEIELVHGAPVYRLRGRLLPVVYLEQVLRPEHFALRPQEAVNIVVLQADQRQFGLVVDGINDTEEIVVKALNKQLKVGSIFAGASIMGDGKVALILDVLRLAQRAGVVTELKDHGMSERAAGQPEASVQTRNYLLFAGPGQSRMAVPLDTLARLEELPSSQVEKAGTDWVTQYRGQILPLVNLEFVMEERRHRNRKKFSESSSDAPLQVLVCNHQGRAVGLVVEQILDIVDDAAELKFPPSRPGVLYSTVINERVTELIDIPAVLNAAGLGTPAQAKAADTAG